MTRNRLHTARSEFGELLLSRSLDWPSIGVFLILILFMALLGGLVVIGAMSSLLHPPPRGVGSVELAALLAFGLSLLAGAVLILRWMFTQVEFREKGVIRRRFGRLVGAMAYSQIDEFVFDVTERHAEGVSSGSTVTIVCRSAKGERFRHRGVFHDPLAASFNPREAESSAIGLCNLRDVLATEMVRRWLAGGAGFQARLGRSGMITRTEFIPASGAEKAMPMPLDQIELTPHRTGSVLVFRRGSKDPTLKIRTGQPNFWPFVLLLQIVQGDLDA